VTKCMMPRQALDSVLNRIADVQVGSFKSANGSWRKMAATWGRRCADLYQLIVARREADAGRRGDEEMNGSRTGAEELGREVRKDEQVEEKRLTIRSASIPLCIPVKCLSGSRNPAGKC
jgi:hypothetical protein